MKFFPVIESANYYSNQSTTTSLWISYPTGSRKGDLLLCVFRSNATVVTPSAGWRVLNHSDTNVGRTFILSKVYEGNETATWNLVQNSSARSNAITYAISHYNLEHYCAHFNTSQTIPTVGTSSNHNIYMVMNTARATNFSYKSSMADYFIYSTGYIFSTTSSLYGKQATGITLNRTENAIVPPQLTVLSSTGSGVHHSGALVLGGVDLAPKIEPWSDWANSVPEEQHFQAHTLVRAPRPSIEVLSQKNAISTTNVSSVQEIIVQTDNHKKGKVTVTGVDSIEGIGAKTSIVTTSSIQGAGVVLANRPELVYSTTVSGYGDIYTAPYKFVNPDPVDVLVQSPAADIFVGNTKKNSIQTTILDNDISITTTAFIGRVKDIEVSGLGTVEVEQLKKVKGTSTISNMSEIDTIFKSLKSTNTSIDEYSEITADSFKNAVATTTLSNSQNVFIETDNHKKKHTLVSESTSIEAQGIKGTVYNSVLDELGSIETTGGLSSTIKTTSVANAASITLKIRVHKKQNSTLNASQSIGSSIQKGAINSCFIDESTSIEVQNSKGAIRGSLLSSTSSINIQEVFKGVVLNTTVEEFGEIRCNEVKPATGNTTIHEFGTLYAAGFKGGVSAPQLNTNSYIIVEPQAKTPANSIVSNSSSLNITSFRTNIARTQVYSGSSIEATGPIGFPAAPELNEEHIFGGVRYYWNGTTWNIVQLSPVFPINPTLNQIFRNNDKFYRWEGISWKIWQPKGATGIFQSLAGENIHVLNGLIISIGDPIIILPPSDIPISASTNEFWEDVTSGGSYE